LTHKIHTLRKLDWNVWAYEMAAKSNERRAIVIGGSIAGLFVGAFLRRIGWRVDIYERSSIELIGRGVGIFATHLELFEALDKCGAGTVDIGVIVYKRITFDRKGNVIAEKPQLQIVTSWDRLRQVLLKAIDRRVRTLVSAYLRLERRRRRSQKHFPITTTSTGHHLPHTIRCASHLVSALLRTAGSSECNLASAYRPTKIARSPNYYRAQRVSSIGLQSRISSTQEPRLPSRAKPPNLEATTPRWSRSWKADALVGRSDIV
jgi:2-polyprenyl-6-methoxyphenol hydroxylase-like FAD-dependent oxidoreductase